MAKPKGGAVLQRFARKERGTPLPISSHTVLLRDGTTAHAQLINLSNADVPDRSYYAEIVGVHHEDRTVRFMFAQPKLGMHLLRSLVIVSMTEAAAMHFITSLKRIKNPSLEEIARQHDIAAGVVSPMPSEEPEQTAGLVANMAAVAIHGNESCIDFYHASAFSHLAAKDTNQMYLEPVVRVNLDTTLLLALMQRLDDLKGSFHPQALVAEEVKDD